MLQMLQQIYLSFYQRKVIVMSQFIFFPNFDRFDTAFIVVIVVTKIYRTAFCKTGKTDNEIQKRNYKTKLWNLPEGTLS